MKAHRMERAASLLLKTQDDIGAIARAVGYEPEPVHLGLPRMLRRIARRIPPRAHAGLIFSLTESN